MPDHLTRGGRHRIQVGQSELGVSAHLAVLGTLKSMQAGLLSTAPALDIAGMRHETRTSRLFAT